MLLRVPATWLRLRWGRYSSNLPAGWGPSDGYDEVEVASSMPDYPNVWTDGSLVLDRVTGISASSAGFYAHQSEDCRGGRRWGHVDHVRHEVVFILVEVFPPSLGLSSLFRELKCGVSF